MLITCSECELPVSDKALSCPHCGNPLKTSHQTRKYNKKAHMRLPNGFGQITEIKGRNLRKPFRAMVTTGKTEEGKPICKLLKPEAYFETYNDAYYALVEYNKNPYELDDGITVSELYDRWSTEYFKNITQSSTRTVTSAWAYCSSVKNMRAKDIRVRHIKGCMDTAESPNIKNRIKSVFNLMLDYALEYELVDHNYARDFKTERAETSENIHTAFTKEELKKLWVNTSTPFVNIILIQCYMGWRPQELCLIKLKDVDFENMSITGGMKTEAGRDRVVPIPNIILSLVKRLYNLSVSLGCENLICDLSGVAYTYDKYYKKFVSTCKDLGLDHKPHDPRKTFVTMCKEAGVDEYAVKYIVGHSISDITEKIYTDRDPKWIWTEIKKLEGL